VAETSFNSLLQAKLMKASREIPISASKPWQGPANGFEKLVDNKNLTTKQKEF